MTKVGRNDPCPCGSGKKFKKCCMGRETAAGATPALTAPAEECLEGYSLSTSQQKRWLDRAKIRSHNRILEMDDAALAALSLDDLDDYELWATAQRLRDLGDRERFWSLRHRIALSDKRHEAIEYADHLEAVVAEELRPRGLFSEALAAASRLIEAGPDEDRTRRSQALEAALQIEAGDRKAGAARFDELRKGPAGLLAAADHVQALARSGHLEQAIEVLESVTPAAADEFLLLGDHFRDEQAALRERAERHESNSDDPWGQLLAALEEEEERRVREPPLDEDALAAARERTLGLQERLTETCRGIEESAHDRPTQYLNIIGTRLLELRRLALPRPRLGWEDLVHASRTTYMSVGDSLLRWLLASSHRHQFVDSMVEVFGEVVSTADPERQATFDLFLSWIACDSQLANGFSVLTAFARERPRARRSPWDDVVAAMEASHFDLYTIGDVDAQDRVTLVSQGGTSTSVSLGSLPPGSSLCGALLARLIELPDGTEIGHGVAIPAAAAGKLAAEIEETVEARREGMSRARALKTAGSKIVTALDDLQQGWFEEGLDWPTPPTRLTPRLALAEGVFHLVDATRASRLLDESGWARRAEETEGVWRLPEHPLEASSSDHRRTVATMSLRNDRLLVHALTRSRLGRALFLIGRSLGPGIHLEGVTVHHRVPEA